MLFMTIHHFLIFFFFFFNDTATTEIYTLSLHDALPISAFSEIPSRCLFSCHCSLNRSVLDQPFDQRSEEHTSELQSLTNLVCRLLLEKKKMGNSPSSLGLLIQKRNFYSS